MGGKRAREGGRAGGGRGGAGAGPGAGPGAEAGGAAELPVEAAAAQVAEAVAKHPACVLVADTGTGKTSRLPALLLGSRALPPGGRALVAQPRRLAAVSVARYVAARGGGEPGGEVGYAVRFETKAAPRGGTRLLYCTAGVLLRILSGDPALRAWDLAVVDEAHERSLDTDLALALCKRAMELRSRDARCPLRLLVMSATLDAARMARYLGPSTPALYLCGRRHFVETLFLRAPCDSYLSAAAGAVERLMVEPDGGAGGVLVFLPGQEDILTLQGLLQAKYPPPEAAGKGKPRPRGRPGREPEVTGRGGREGAALWVCPLFASASREAHERAFEVPPAGVRKVVLATNVAETSVTVPGIRYVVDSGFVKVNRFDARAGAATLRLEPVSQAQALQRAGRAGREGPGKCLRLFSEDAWGDLAAYHDPEIRHASLEGLVLRVKASGGDLDDFDFLDPPPREALVAALEHLRGLGALPAAGGGLSPVGDAVAKLPLEPPLARCLVAAQALGCRPAVAAACALLSTEALRTPQRDREGGPGSGGLLSLPPLLAEYLAAGEACKGSSEGAALAAWCRAHGLRAPAMAQAARAAVQLEKAALALGIGEDAEVRRGKPPAKLQRPQRPSPGAPSVSAGAGTGAEDRDRELLRKVGDSVQASFVSGLYYNWARQAGQRGRFLVARTGMEIRLPGRERRTRLAAAPALIFAEMSSAAGRLYLRHAMAAREEWMPH